LDVLTAFGCFYEIAKKNFNTSTYVSFFSFFQFVEAKPARVSSVNDIIDCGAKELTAFGLEEVFATGCCQDEF